MCEFCENIVVNNTEYMQRRYDGGDFIYHDGNGYGILIDTGDSGCLGSLLNISFCPMCGRDLRSEERMSDIVYYNVNDMEQNGIKVLFDEETILVGFDFTEHDKAFEDKIADLEKRIRELIKEKDEYKRKCNDFGFENQELKQRIAGLESKEKSDLPFDPLECANYLINATYERETNGIERTFHNLPDKVNSDRYTVDDLEQIAEHLLVYCKHNNEGEE